MFSNEIFFQGKVSSSPKRSPVLKAVIITGFIFTEQAFNSFSSLSKDKTLFLMYSFSENS
jgi:hypothetical protein